MRSPAAWSVGLEGNSHVAIFWQKGQRTGVRSQSGIKGGDEMGIDRETGLKQGQSDMQQE